MGPGKFNGCARGIFGLSSWEPLRKPGEPARAPLPSTNNSRVGHSVNRGSHTSNDEGNPLNSHSSANGQNRVQEETQYKNQNKDSREKVQNGLPVKNVPLLAKYTYKANQSSPLGEEMSVAQGDHVRFLEVHDKYDEWWLAETFDGKHRGYLPAKYLMVIKVSSMPWLDQKHQQMQAELEEEERKAKSSNSKNTFKPYISAYNRPSTEESERPEDKYKCDLCDKKFTGPQPYKAHMASKNHKENVEYYNSTD